MIADVAEADIAAIEVGMPVTVTVRARPTEPVEGKVDLHLSGADAGDAHRAGAYRAAESRSAVEDIDVCRCGVHGKDGTAVTAVPDSAIIDSGARQVVIVAKGEGRFEPRAVKLGRRGGGYAEVTGGLASRARRSSPPRPSSSTPRAICEQRCKLSASRRCNHDRRPHPLVGAQRLSGRAGGVFVTVAGIYAVSRVPLDAIPDLSDVQVIVYTEYPGQAPQVVEDQVTYPLTTAMLTVPKSRVVRGFSFFGVSFVYVIFEDGTDLYWARSRVLEYLNSAAQPVAGRRSAQHSGLTRPASAGSINMWCAARSRAWPSCAPCRTGTIRFGLAKAEGVAEVASVGGFVKQYSVVIDPRRLQALGIPLSKIRDVIRASNMDVGGRTVEVSETEFAMRGRGYIKSLSDLEQIVVKNDNGVPVLLKDVARVELTPDERRGITEMNGEGEVVSGIALQRFGENALSVIQHVKDRLAEIAPSLPEGVTIDAVYDRSDLINRAIDTLKRTLIEESFIVALVCVIFLLHARSALVAIITLPLGVLIAYICMWLLGLSSNIMSLGGIAIAIGAMVDAAIVMIENAHKRLERAPPGKPRSRGHDRGRRRGRPGAVLQPAHHHRLLPADLRAGSAGRPAVQAARLHQDLRHGGGGAAVGLAGAGADDAIRARPHHARAQEPGEPVLDLDLPPGDPARAAIQGGHDPDRARRPRREPLAGVEARQRVHAHAERGHAVLHAGHAARHLRHQGGRAAADPGQDHQVVPRGRICLGQSRARLDRHRSGADRDGRDGDQSEARGASGAPA